MFRLRLVLQNNIARTARPYACRDLVGKHADPPLLQCLAFLPKLCDRTKQPQTSRALHNVLRLPPESPAGQNSRWWTNLAATSAVVSRESRSRQRSRGQAGYHNVLPFLHEIPEQAGYCTINPCTQLRMQPVTVAEEPCTGMSLTCSAKAPADKTATRSRVLYFRPRLGARMDATALICTKTLQIMENSMLAPLVKMDTRPAIVVSLL